MGIFNEKVEISFDVDDKYCHLIKTKNPQLIVEKNFKLMEMGIGGMDDKIFDIFKKIFTSRRISNEMFRKLGMKHVKGLLLYGPPGTGKTLMARKLSKVLNSVEPKIINGPELFDKFVGETEKKLRNLFDDAIKDNQKFGHDSPLHVIIFDEIDAICKKRGSNAGVSDNAVTTLLTMIDGVIQFDNILIIGMTNRKDMIDEAILRPGRLEVHIEIGLPDLYGREQIYRIHTENMRKNEMLCHDVDLKYLSAISENFTGAEIESVVNSAIANSIARTNDILNFNANIKFTKESAITTKDFSDAIDELKPMFGKNIENHVENIINYGPSFVAIKNKILDITDLLINDSNMHISTILIHGENGTGKTTFAKYIASLSQFSFIKLITPESFIKSNESAKIDTIIKYFDDASKSPFSILILDDIDQIFEYVDRRFSANIFNTIRTLITKKLQKNKLLIIATTSQYNILKELNFHKCFNSTINMKCLLPSEILYVLKHLNLNDNICQHVPSKIDEIPIKHLLFIISLLCNKYKNNYSINNFMDIYQNFSFID